MSAYQRSLGRLPAKKSIGQKRGRQKGYVMSVEHRRKLSEAAKGEKGSGWKGGRMSEKALIRASLNYRLWREAVFKRDNFTCQVCGIRGVRLNADHIKPFCLYPKLRLDLNNGRTLCVPCHMKTDTWGNKALRSK